MALRVHDGIIKVRTFGPIEDYSLTEKDEADGELLCKLIDVQELNKPALKFDVKHNLN